MPIVIPAGSTKGIYITVNETSADDNLIGQIRKMPGSTCPSDFTEFFETSTWSENDDLSLSEGAYKDSWVSSGADEAARYYGTIYYTRTSTNQGELTGSPSSSPTHPPTGSPTVSSSGFTRRLLSTTDPHTIHTLL